MTSMDPAYGHLILNHLPVIGGVAAVLLLASGLVRKNTAVSLAALGLLVVVAAIAVPVFTTGRASEGRIVPDDARALTQHHEDAAIAAMVALEAAALLALAALFVWKSSHRFPTFAAVATLVVGICASLLLVRAAMLGHQMLRVGRAEPAAAVSLQR